MDATSGELDSLPSMSGMSCARSASVQGQGVEEVVRDVVQECLAVVQASNVTVAGDIRQAVQRPARSMPGQLLQAPSASQDGHDHNRDQLETP